MYDYFPLRVYPHRASAEAANAGLWCTWNSVPDPFPSITIDKHWSLPLTLGVFTALESLIWSYTLPLCDNCVRFFIFFGFIEYIKGPITMLLPVFQLLNYTYRNYYLDGTVALLWSQIHSLREINCQANEANFEKFLSQECLELLCNSLTTALFRPWHHHIAVDVREI